MFAIQRHRLEFLVSFSVLAMLGYLAWQGMYGPRSFHYRDNLVNQLAQSKADFITIENQRKTVENRVQHMRPESVDADLLDEFARRDLNMAKPTDLVINLVP
jgi:cell division protein FtsB